MAIKAIPGTETIEFKEGFVKRYERLTDWEVFKKFSLSFLRKSIRVNTLKIGVDDLVRRLKKDWTLEAIPWCTDGFWFEHKKGRLDVGNTLEHALGYYYVQEAASMIPPLVLDAQPGELVLDACAAPGSKASQLSQAMKNKGLLVANDISGKRIAALGINMQRCGCRNVIISHMLGQAFAKSGLQFNKILVDAPCSGTGTIRKSLKTLRMWNPGMIKRLSRIQRKVLASSWNALAPGGTLVYSTCSLEPEENEGVISWALQELDGCTIEPIHLSLKRSMAVQVFEGEEYDPRVQHGLRLWPQDNDTEGFFVAKLHKSG